MSLPSAGFVFGSASSAQSFVASYRRAQLLVAEATIASSPDVTDTTDDGGSLFEDSEEELDLEEGLETPQARVSEGFINQLDWDSHSDSASRTPATPFLPSSPASPFLGPGGESPTAPANEQTPLLASRRVSFTNREHPRHMIQRPILSRHTQAPSPPPVSEDTRRPVMRPVLRRAASSGSVKGQPIKLGGESTFGQTLFNSIAILLGIGMLSEPLAFAQAGWVMGTILIVAYGFISCHTAKLLARIIADDPRLRTYTDIGRKAFGPRATFPISLIFCLELFSVSVILVTLYADSLHSIIPHYSADTYKLWGILILIPTVFLPLSLLSFTSVLGIVSTLLMIIVILIDGISKKEHPGSLWDPMPTSLSWNKAGGLGLSFGLFMAGFSGHAVIPSLARDMQDPTQFDSMINWAFVVATAIYVLIGWVGYLMFGNDVSEEVSLDLLRTPGFNPALNKACLWLLVISPLSKFALATQPLNATISIFLGIDELPQTHDEIAKRLTQHGKLFSRKRFFTSLQKIVMVLLAVGVSIGVPDFGALMAFMGSFAAFLICVIGPIGAHVSINKKCTVLDGTAFVIAVVMAVWGTATAFMAAEE